MNTFDVNIDAMVMENAELHALMASEILSDAVAGEQEEINDQEIAEIVAAAVSMTAIPTAAEQRQSEEDLENIEYFERVKVKLEQHADKLFMSKNDIYFLSTDPVEITYNSRSNIKGYARDVSVENFRHKCIQFLNSWDASFGSHYLPSCIKTTHCVKNRHIPIEGSTGGLCVVVRLNLDRICHENKFILFSQLRELNYLMTKARKGVIFKLKVTCYSVGQPPVDGVAENPFYVEHTNKLNNYIRTHMYGVETDIEVSAMILIQALDCMNPRFDTITLYGDTLPVDGETEEEEEIRDNRGNIMNNRFIESIKDYLLYNKRLYLLDLKENGGIDDVLFNTILDLLYRSIGGVYVNVSGTNVGKESMNALFPPMITLELMIFPGEFSLRGYQHVSAENVDKLVDSLTILNMNNSSSKFICNVRSILIGYVRFDRAYDFYRLLNWMNEHLVMPRLKHVVIACSTVLLPESVEALSIMLKSSQRVNTVHISRFFVPEETADAIITQFSDATNIEEFVIDELRVGSVACKDILTCLANESYISEFGNDTPDSWGLDELVTARESRRGTDSLVSAMRSVEITRG